MLFVPKRRTRPLSFTAYPFLAPSEIVSLRFAQVKCFTLGFRGFALSHQTAHRHFQSRLLSYFTFFRGQRRSVSNVLGSRYPAVYASLSEGRECGCDMWAGSASRLVPADTEVSITRPPVHEAKSFFRSFPGPAPALVKRVGSPLRGRNGLVDPC